MKCSKSNKDSEILCVENLKAGKVLILPTDTVYGFSAIVSEKFNTAEKIRMIKGRSETKPFIQLIAEPSDIFKFTDEKIPPELLKYWPGPLTIILKDKRLAGASVDTTAFRCPGDEWLRRIIKETGSVIYSTSVNKSGCPVLETESDILKEFENSVDLIVIDGDKKNALPSTIVKVENGKYSVLRQGEIKIK